MPSKLVCLFVVVAVFCSCDVFGSVATVTIRNRSDSERLQWVHTTIPFPYGAVKSEADLRRFSVGHGSIDWRALKWHMTRGVKHSVALASLKIPVYLRANEEITVDVEEESRPNELPFGLGPNLTAILNRGTLVTDLMAVAKMKDDPQLHVAFFAQNPRIVFDGLHSKCLGWHTNFGEHALSMSIWMDINNQQDFGNFVISIGNQTFERPHSGGIDLEFVDLYVRLPLQVEIRHGADYGAEASQPSFELYRRTRLIATDQIADGAARTFRGVWGAVVNPDSLTGRSFQAELADPLFGVADESAWRASDAAGITGAISPARGTVDQLRQSVEWMGGASFNVRKDATENFARYLNKRTRSTGDQADFSSNIPVVYQQVILAQSTAPLQHLLHGVQQESHRPTYYFFGNRPMTWSDTSVATSFWDGRIHYDPNHNPGNVTWLRRVERHSGFKLGNAFGWTGQDNQHYGNHHIRAAYELTGDGYLKDLIVYHQSMALWSYLGDGTQRYLPDAERAQRLMEDAIQDYLLAPEAPEALSLATRLARKIHEVVRPTIESRLTNYGVAAWETVYNDPRYSQCTGTTQNVDPRENVCHVVWQSGFSLSALASAYRHGITELWGGSTRDVEWIVDRYMDDRRFRFFENGNNKEWVRFNDWEVSGFGFTHAWLSGWVPAVRLRQTHENWEWFRDTFIPYMRNNAFPTDRLDPYWGNLDKWRTFE